MTQHDLERALELQVQDAHLSEEALRNIRRAVYKEEKPVKRKMSMGFILAMVLVMLSATALAATGGILELLSRLKGGETEVLPGGEELFGEGRGTWSDGYVNYTVVGSAYDGRALGTVIEITPRMEDTLLLTNTCVSIKCWEYGNKPCVPPIEPAKEGDTEDPVLRYARENGYSQVVMVDAATISGGGGVFYSEWKDNTITMFHTSAHQEETVTGEYWFRSIPYLRTPYTDWERMTEPFTLTAPAPLWETEVTLEEPIAVPEYGLLIDRVKVTGTKLGVYADMHCQLTNSWLARRTLVVGVDEKDEFLGYGLLETGSYEVAMDAQSHTYPASLPAMEEMPDMLRLRIYDAGKAREPVVVEIPLR